MRVTRCSAKSDHLPGTFKTPEESLDAGCQAAGQFNFFLVGTQMLWFSCPKAGFSWHQRAGFGDKLRRFFKRMQKLLKHRRWLVAAQGKFFLQVVDFVWIAACAPDKVFP